MRPWIRVLGLSLGLFATAAQADDGNTVLSSVKPAFDGGELTGCQVNFSVMHRNPEYFGNDLVVVDVGILISGRPSLPPTAAIKLGVAKLGGATIGQFRAPTNAYLINGLETNIADKVDNITAETPGYSMFLYSLGGPTIEIVFNSLRTGIFEVGYSMNDGSSGSKLVGDISVAENLNGTPVRDETAVDRLQTCFLTLPYIKSLMGEGAVKN